MVEPSPELLERITNTIRLVSSGRPDLVPSEAGPESPYIPVESLQTLLLTRPWAEPRPVTGEPQAVPGAFVTPQPRVGGPAYIGAPVHDRVLVLCVDFSDRPQQTSVDTIRNRFFSETANIGHTFRNYYAEISYGKFIPEGSVHGWYRAPNPSTYYTNRNNGIGSYPNNIQKLYEDALDLAANDPNIDWDYIDANGDGIIDHVFVLHAGGEGAMSGNLNDFWAAAWSIPTPKRMAGKTFSAFAMSAEYLSGPGDSTKPGVDSHEFGHLLGLPDLYDTTQNSRGTGIWSLMSGGSWGDRANTPVHMDPWSKHTLGWSEVILNPTGQVTLLDAETNPTHVHFSTTDSNQIFIVENRQQKSFDQFLPGSGLMIWRINDAMAGNNNPSCYQVGVVEADGSNDLARNVNAGTASDPFPGQLNVRSIGPDTSPSRLRLCDGSPENLSITNISDSGPTMTFNAQWIGNPPPLPSTRWRCTNTGCVSDPGGAYATRELCQGYCQGPPPAGQRYRCDNGKCVADTNGPFISAEECQAQCQPPTTIRYRCENGVCIPDINGAYETLVQCQQACQAPPPPTKYSCINGQCIVDPNGQYTSITDCQNVCTPPSTPKYSCVNGQCIVDPNGQYTSITDCQNACITPSTPKYSCVNGVCVQDPNGRYSSLAECQKICTLPPFPRYSCVNGRCVQNPNGQYTSLTQCQSACRLTGQRYSCVSFNVCIRDPTGPYPTLDACRAACGSSGITMTMTMGNTVHNDNIIDTSCMALMSEISSLKALLDQKMYGSIVYNMEIDNKDQLVGLQDQSSNTTQGQIPTLARYRCFRFRACIIDPYGRYTSLSQCLSACAARSEPGSTSIQNMNEPNMSNIMKSLPTIYRQIAQEITNKGQILVGITCQDF